MQQCRTNCEHYKLSYQWKIHEFVNYIDTSCQKKDITLHSTNFVLPPGRQGKFWLEITIVHTDNDRKNSMGAVLCWQDIDAETNTKITLFILTSENKKYNERSFSTLCTSEDDKSNGFGWYPFIETEILFNKSADLLPDNVLTLQCDLIVYEGTPKSYDTKYSPKLPQSSINPFKKLLKNQMYTDFTIFIGAEQYRVHKLFLIAQSPVFQAKFEKETAEQNNNYIRIQDISPEIFKIFLDYIYTNEIQMDMNYNNIIKLLATANLYQVAGLKEKCYERLSTLIDSENAVDILLLAEKYGNSQLAELAKNFISLHNAGPVAFEYLLARLRDNCLIQAALGGVGLEEEDENENDNLTVSDMNEEPSIG